MYIQKLYLRHFRNYTEETFVFSPEMNLIHGTNAQGKTNLLEALFLVGTGRSFRTPHLKELIQQRAPFFFIEAEFKKDDIMQKTRLSFDGEIKKLDVNHTSYSHFNPLLGMLPIVLLSPEDALLVTGSPAERRSFLNLHIAQSDPLYVFHLTRYHKAIKHRNALLKQKKEEGMLPWEEIMVCAARYLRQSRERLIQELSEELQKAMQILSGKQDEITICYKPSFTENYAKHRLREFPFGATLLGPHRDDLEIVINQLPAASFASQGQIRSAIAALRLAQWKHLSKRHGHPVLFCIDDFGVHLDEARREALLSYLSSMAQVFLTSPEALRPRACHTLRIEAGTLRGNRDF